MRLPPKAIRGFVKDRRRVAAAFWIGLIVVYVVIFFASDRLAFPLDRDETHFWPTSQRFSGRITLDTLRNYEELNTPLPFVVFGQFARFGESGLRTARAFNLALSAGVFVLIAYAGGRVTARSLRAAFGLVLCPYFLGFATHVYTDVMATFLVCAGLALHLRSRFAAAALAWTPRIWIRQHHETLGYRRVQPSSPMTSPFSP